MVLHILNAVFDIAGLCKSSPTKPTANNKQVKYNKTRQKVNGEQQSKKRKPDRITSRHIDHYEDEEMEEELLAEEENMNRIMTSISTDSML